ncbi:MAG TPA: hypothetical protein VHE61_19575 [Opitutaceae bacterium]|nr:hypothetical protein [Opitutaceae bacterium]
MTAAAAGRSTRPAGRCLVLLISLVLAATAVQAADVPLADADIAAAFQARRRQVLATAITGLDPKDPTKGGFLNVAAALQQGRLRPAALARLARLNQPTPTDNMFWMYPMAAVMTAGRAGLDAPSRARIRELWKTYWPSRGDTENHWALYYSSLYLAAQEMPAMGPEQWFDGKSSAENMAEARSYLEHWMRVTTSYGQGEYDSPNYIEEYIIPMSLLAGWTEDAAFRQEARMMLDYLIYDYAVENVDGFYGGAHSRVYPRQIVDPGQTPAAGLGWLLFGFGDPYPAAASIVLAMSGYTPPPILERIARDTAHRPYVERELKRTRWLMRHAGPASFVIGDKRTRPVYKYSYVDRDFVLGSSQGGILQPIQQQTWSLVWRPADRKKQTANTFFSVQPYSSPVEGTTFFAENYDVVTNLIVRSKADYDSEDKLPGGSPYEQVFQHRTALIGLYDIPPDSRFQHVTTFFSRDLVGTTVDPSGWIFAQGGPVYIAFRPFAAGTWKPNDWTGLLRNGGGGWISAGFQQWGTGHRCFVSDSPHNGYVVQVAAARDFASFAAFEAAVRALPLKFSLVGEPEATFTALDGSVLRAKYGAAPSVDGRAVDYAAWPLFDSPFAHEARGSRRLDLHEDGEGLSLDFNTDTICETAGGTAR